MCGTAMRILTNETRKDTQLKFYKVLAAPIPLYWCDYWALNRAEKRIIETADWHDFLKELFQRHCKIQQDRYHGHVDGVRLCLWTSATPRWYMSGEPWWNDIDRKNKTCPSATLFTTDRTWTGLVKKPASAVRGRRITRLSYGTANKLTKGWTVCTPLLRFECTAHKERGPLSHSDSSLQLIRFGRSTYFLFV
jgi:hypothetical protein